jgi:hypothetical protein
LPPLPSPLTRPDEAAAWSSAIPKTLKHVLPGNAQRTPSPDVLIEFITTPVNLYPLSVGERHMLRVAAEVVPELADQLQLLVRGKLLDVHYPLRHG